MGTDAAPPFYFKAQLFTGPTTADKRDVAVTVTPMEPTVPGPLGKALHKRGGEDRCR